MTKQNGQRTNGRGRLPLKVEDARELRPRRRRSARRILEPLAMGVMALGFLMMFQPFTMGLYSYSFSVVIFGTLMFIIVSRLPE
ncbi:MAG: hypothetical protein KatS3mg057_0365 [Herpetosiphonaceae bacterium]|nr:MAG: hypothetical protein KatS3mg057_0365 [Herpetosiphonaceae bacterium]